MKIINLLINEDVLKAELALQSANSDDLLELCRRYLLQLAKYGEQLHELGGMPETNITEQSVLGRELVEQSRKAVRAAIEVTVRERNKVESLIESFTLINAHDAAETFNRLKHKGANTWETRGGEVHVAGNGERMTLQDAVEAAGRLRRDAYLADKITFFRH